MESTDESGARDGTAAQPKDQRREPSPAAVEFAMLITQCFDPDDLATIINLLMNARETRRDDEQKEGR